MRVVRFHELGGPEVLRIEDLPAQQPGPGEVRLRIEAVGLNQAEALFRRGSYFQTPVLPSRIGYEASGVVEALGPGVTSLSVGEAVSVLPFLEMTSHGVYADEAVVPASSVIPRPAELDPIQAAAVWMPAFTALVGLTEALGRQPDAQDRVLVTAAASSVGLAAIRLAVQRLGCGAVLGVTRDPSKAAAIQAAGAVPIVGADTKAQTAAITAALPEGPTIVFDPVAGPAFGALADLAASGATLLLYGALGGVDVKLSAATAIGKALTVRGFSIGEAAPGTAPFARVVEQVRQGIAAGWVKPEVDRVFPLGDVVEAHRRLESGGQTGKIVLTTG